MNIRPYPVKMFVRVVGDGALSNPKFYSGRLVAALIVDCTERRDLADLIRLHQGTGPGDVVSTWVKGMWSSDDIGLHLKFIRPTPGEALIRFTLPEHLFLIDAIIQNHACYIQSNDYGTKLSATLGNTPRIWMEIPSEGLPFDWDKIVAKHLFKRFRDDGLGRAEAKRAAMEAVKMSRGFYRFREVLKISRESEG